MSEVAMFGVEHNPARHIVSSAVARVRLDELDRRRAASTVRRAPQGTSGVNFYLMSELEAALTVPDDAIDAIKVTLGRAFRNNSSVVGALKRVYELAYEQHLAGAWALVETQGNGLKMRPTDYAFAHDLLSTEFARWPSVERTHFTAPSHMRILVELIAATDTASNAAGESARQTWEQIAARLASYAEPAPANAVTDVPEAVVVPSRRDDILAFSVDALGAVKRAGSHAEDAAAWASRERRAGRLFGVWSSAQRAFVHPDFQFAPEGGMRAGLAPLLRVLRTKHGFNPVTSDKGGWSRAYWLYQPREELSARALAARTMDHSDPVASALALSLLPDERPRTPAEALADAPDAVLALAQSLTDEMLAAHD
jgi:hypothetical protein